MMGTIVTIEVVERRARRHDAAERDRALDRACEWFGYIERLCTRFDPQSDVRRLAGQVGIAVPVGDILFAVVEFALAVAAETRGAFDPTVGLQMQARGFNRDYRTGRAVGTEVRADGPVSYRDVHLDRDRKTVTLDRPLLLDLGAVAKGLAIDTAARELQPFENFAIDAGGDLYLAGTNALGEPWSVGVRHPRRDRELIESLRISDAAVCTSGDYERPGAGGPTAHHILDPRNGASAGVVVSATVIGPTAMLADALATAAFVLGPEDGIRLLERHGVDGLIVSPALERYATRRMRSDDTRGSRTGTDAHGDRPILPNA